MITPFKSVSRCAVEERDGRLYVAGVRIIVSAERSSAPLDDNTLYRIDAALTAEAKAVGSNMPVCISAMSRLHRCGECGAPFIAHASARLCSAECRIAVRRAAQRRASAKLTVRRDARRAGLQVRCRQCGEPVEGALRASRAFCSNACRQSAYRARTTALA
jgi:endogenous inhibitor of DNA gyrase (YacG/DUF329 family)